MKPSVGLIGLGIMGSGMAKNLLKNDFPLSVWNRSIDKTTTLKDLGAKVAETPKSLAEESDIVLTCLTDEAALQSVLLEGEESLTKAKSLPKVLVDLSTISPLKALEFADNFKKHEIAFIDAPVSGGDIGAANGTLTVMAGGDQQAFDMVLPILSAIGSNIVYTGPSGSGQRTKCINQIVVALNVAAMSEGLHLANQSGLDAYTTLKAISGGAAGSWCLDNYAPRVIKNDLAPGFYAKDMLKDLNYVTELSDSVGCNLPGLQLVHKLFRELVELDKEAKLGNHALIERYRKDL